MLGLLVYAENGAKGAARSLFGDTAILTAFVPRGKGLRSAHLARRAAKLFARRRIRLAAFPEDYPYRTVFTARGVMEADEAALRRACADKIILCALKRQGAAPQRAAVALFARARSAALDQAVCALASRVRYLTLCVPDSESLCERLRRQYGAAARMCKAGEPVCCDLRVSYDGADAASALDLCAADAVIDYALRTGAELPKGGGRSLLAALLQSGALRPEDIEITAASWGGADKLSLTYG